MVSPSLADRPFWAIAVIEIRDIECKSGHLPSPFKIAGIARIASAVNFKSPGFVDVAVHLWRRVWEGNQQFNLCRIIQNYSLVTLLPFLLSCTYSSI